jgi:DNA-directed RNA polymerase subunit F
MDAPSTFQVWWDWLVYDCLLADDEYRTPRIIGLVVLGTFGWRALWIYSQIPPAPRPTTTPATSPPGAARRSWFPTREEKIAQAIHQVQLETDLLLRKTSSIRASAELEQARAHLQKLIAELKPEPAPQAKNAPALAALTMQEIDLCLTLIDLSPEIKTQLRSLLANCIEEKS